MINSHEVTPVKCIWLLIIKITRIPPNHGSDKGLKKSPMRGLIYFQNAEWCITQGIFTPVFFRIALFSQNLDNKNGNQSEWLKPLSSIIH
jgi:hypothetical protein